MSFKPLIIASRQSPLAVAQAELVRHLFVRALNLPEEQAEIAFPIKTYVTTGDQRMDPSLAQIGGKGLFTKEVEHALLTGEADIAVHSMKDMPAVMPEGLQLAAVPSREDPRDALVSTDGQSLADLPEGTRVGTSSIRRRAQIIRKRPDLTLVPMRGNVGTRLSKLEKGEADVTLLAEAGLKRLHHDHVARIPMSLDEMLPAPGQGVLCIQTRQGDERATEICQLINCTKTAMASAAERAFVAKLDASCRTPIAAHATLDDDQVSLRGELLTPDGQHVFLGDDRYSANLEAAAQGGTELAQRLIRDAGSLMNQILGRS